MPSQSWEVFGDRQEQQSPRTSQAPSHSSEPGCSCLEHTESSDQIRQRNGMEKKLLPTTASVLKDPGCPQSTGGTRAARKPQPRQEQGTGAELPGRGTGREQTPQRQQRGLERDEGVIGTQQRLRLPQPPWHSLAPPAPALLSQRPRYHGRCCPGRGAAGDGVTLGWGCCRCPCRSQNCCCCSARRCRRCPSRGARGAWRQGEEAVSQAEWLRALKT